jgi:hypothetical protein
LLRHTLLLLGNSPLLLLQFPLLVLHPLSMLFGLTLLMFLPSPQPTCNR